MHLIDSLYQFRGINDENVFVSDETQRLLYSYSNLFTRVSLAYRDSLINISKGLPTEINKAEAKKEILELKEYLVNYSYNIYRQNSDIFRLFIDRVFISKGFGTVVTGTVISGKISLGDNVHASFTSFECN